MQGCQLESGPPSTQILISSHHLHFK